uniref:Uncharacterized protein n=1 Tax=Mycobacterium leprae TaxID=1769 RepID=O33035_MYCLR|nr:hypothetical protein MLCB250.60 [Mycobacterium leprae]
MVNLKPGVVAYAQVSVDDLMFSSACYVLETVGEHRFMCRQRHRVEQCH